MSTFLLVPGAGGAAWYWHRVVPLLQAAGHAAIALELPGPDERIGLPEYRDMTVRAGEGHGRLVVVAQSMGAFTAVPACRHLPVQRLVLNNAMVPAPRECANDWWTATGSEAARIAGARDGGWTTEFDMEAYFFHDVDPDVLAAGAAHAHPEAEIAFVQPCDFLRWPDVPTTVLAGEGDRLFPFAFQQRVARRRLGLEVTPVPGGHLNALSRPEELAATLLGLASPA
jgi:pimeloyl-ACP methyl ester carboxylesterase